MDSPAPAEVARALASVCREGEVKVVVAESRERVILWPLEEESRDSWSAQDSARLGEVVAQAVRGGKLTVVSSRSGSEAARVVDSRPPCHELTRRQVEVLRLVAEGYSVRQIGALLEISPKTAEFHKGQIMQRLGRHNTAELVKYAIDRGITDVS
jgi:DNA-binding NarL/FixJ family response regulator